MRISWALGVAMLVAGCLGPAELEKPHEPPEWPMNSHAKPTQPAGQNAVPIGEIPKDPVATPDGEQPPADGDAARDGGTEDVVTPEAGDPAAEAVEGSEAKDPSSEAQDAPSPAEGSTP